MLKDTQLAKDLRLPLGDGRRRTKRVRLRWLRTEARAPGEAAAGEQAGALWGCPGTWLDAMFRHGGGCNCYIYPNTPWHMPVYMPTLTRETTPIVYYASPMGRVWDTVLMSSGVSRLPTDRVGRTGSEHTERTPSVALVRTNSFLLAALGVRAARVAPSDGCQMDTQAYAEGIMVCWLLTPLILAWPTTIIVCCLFIA